MVFTGVTLCGSRVLCNRHFIVRSLQTGLTCLHLNAPLHIHYNHSRAVWPACGTPCAAMMPIRSM